MLINVISGIILILISGNNIQNSILNNNFLTISIISDTLGMLLGILWILTPSIMYFVSKENKSVHKTQILSKDEKQYIMQIANETWKFFEKYLYANV